MAKRVQKSLTSERSVRGLLDPVHIGSPTLGIEYKQVVTETLRKLSRHKFLIMAMVAAALVLGIVAALAMPKRYTAEAFIREGLAASNSASASHATTGERPVAFDASLLVETRSQMFQSHQLARQVVQSLGLERLRPIVGRGRLSTWLRARVLRRRHECPRIPGGHGCHEADAGLVGEDRAAGLSDRAALQRQGSRACHRRDQCLRGRVPADNVAAEIVRAARRGASRVDGDPGHARRQASQGAERRECGWRAREALMKDQLTKTADDIQKSAGENITFAEASVIPSSPNPPLIIGFALLGGLASASDLPFGSSAARSAALAKSAAAFRCLLKLLEICDYEQTRGRHLRPNEQGDLVRALGHAVVP